MACKSVPKASPERPGSVPERPRRAPGVPEGSPRAPRDARNDALERPGARRGDQNRRQVASGSGKIEFSSCSSFAKHRRSDFSSIFVDFRFFCEVCEPLKVLRLPVKTEVRLFALRVESLARCNLEKPRKSVPRSTQNRRKSRLEAARATFSVDFCRSKRPGRATRSDSGRFGRLSERLGETKSVEVGRSGSVGSAQGARIPESPGGNSYRDMKKRPA